MQTTNNNDISGYKLKLTSIGENSWQLFINKIDDSSDYVRVIFGITEQIGGATRKFNVLEKYIMCPDASNDDPMFLYPFDGELMKNRRVWVALEPVKRNKGKRGTGIGSYIALSPVQSKWVKTIGSSTLFKVKTLDIAYFKKLFTGDLKLNQGFAALLGE